MGYESRIYIVEKHELYDEEIKKRFATEIAKFDLGKCYFLSDCLRACPITDCYIYADDGNTRIATDKYEEELTEATLQAVISILEKAISNGENYRKIFPLLATLNSLEEHKHQWGELAILHFGY